jgi:quinol monooxygenase YgiN
MTMCTAAAVAAVGAGNAAASPAAAIGHGFHARMKAKPGMGNALIALLFDAPAFELNECRVFLIGRSKSDPDVIFVTEGWTSEEAHTRFTQTDVARNYTARFGPLVDEWTTVDEIVVGGKAVLA